MPTAAHLGSVFILLFEPNRFQTVVDQAFLWTGERVGLTPFYVGFPNVSLVLMWVGFARAVCLLLKTSIRGL